MLHAMQSPTHLPLPANTSSTPSPRWIVISLIGFVLASLWDLAGQDVAMARWWGTAQKIALHDNHFLVNNIHKMMRIIGRNIVVLLSIGM